MKIQVKHGKIYEIIKDKNTNKTLAGYKKVSDEEYARKEAELMKPVLLTESEYGVINDIDWDLSKITAQLNSLLVIREHTDYQVTKFNATITEHSTTLSIALIRLSDNTLIDTVKILTNIVSVDAEILKKMVLRVVKIVRLNEKSLQMGNYYREIKQ